MRKICNKVGKKVKGRGLSKPPQPKQNQMKPWEVVRCKMTLECTGKKFIWENG